MSENTPKITFIGPPITVKQFFKKVKNLPFFAPFISKIKTGGIFNFLSVRYLSKGLVFLKTWHIRVNHCWNYGPPNLLFRIFRCCLSHLKNRQTKIVENLTIHFLKTNIKTSVWWKFQILQASDIWFHWIA